MSYNKTTGKFEGFIYIIKNLINGKEYIGQTTTTINHRFGQHCTSLYKTRHMPIVAAINKYGKENFSINVINKYESAIKEDLINKLNKAEIYYIEKYNTQTPIGYNITSGGNNVSSVKSKQVDVYTCDGIFLDSFDSCSDADEYYNLSNGTVSDCCNGNTLSVYKKYVFRFKGEPFDKYEVFHYKKSKYIYKFDLDGNLINKYPNSRLAGLDTYKDGNNIGSSILRAIDSNRIAYGFYWSSTGKFDFDINSYRNRMPIDKYDLKGNKIDTYISASEACKSINKSVKYVSQIINVCRGKSKHSHGYIWRFKDDPFDLYDTSVKPTKIKVDRYNINGEFIATYDSYQNALRAIGKDIDQGCNIRKGCLGISSIVFGNVWRFHGESFSKYPVYKNRGGSDKPVDQYDINGIYLSTYPSSAAAGRAIGLSSGCQIANVCKGKAHFAGGYLWKYHKE